MDFLKIYYQNVRGLRSKCREVKINILNNDHDIYILTESWLNDSVFDGEIFDSRYTVYRRDRNAMNGGGVLIAVSNDIISHRMTMWESSCEDLWVTVDIKILGKSKHIAICALYLPPPVSKDKLEDFISHTNVVISKNDHVLLAGDFNLSSLTWSQQQGVSHLQISNNPSSTLDAMFVDFIEENSLNQYNYVVNTNQRILDLVLSNTTELKIKESCNPISIVDSHHPPLHITVTSNKKQLVTEIYNERYNFYKANYDSIVTDLNNISWIDVLSKCPDVNTMVMTFYHELDILIKKHVPKCKPNNSKYPTWFSKKIINLLKLKHKARLKYKKYKNPIDQMEFVELREQCNKLLKNEYKSYIENIESNISSNPKYFWTHLKNLKKSSNTYPSRMVLDDQEASNGFDICNLFAKNFSSVYEVNSSLSHTSSNPVSNVSLCYIQFTQHEVFKKLKRLDLSKGAGPDNLPPIFLVRCAEPLSLPVSIIYNESLKTGIYPSFWKQARIVPIYKKGDRSNIANYRPISLISVLPKMLEALLRPTFVRHVQQLLSNAQHGFTKSRSTATNLTNFSTFLSESIDSRVQVDTIYTDFSKAFDKVNHSLLIKKLSNFGFGGTVLSWLESYVTDRSSFVVVKGHVSKLYHSTSGVPQGSVLGPILFNIFINDVTECFQESNCFIFADDLKIAKVIKSPNDSKALQEDLDRLAEWSHKNFMVLNPHKCSFIKFTRNRNSIQTSYNINGVALAEQEVVRDLGITFDTKLSFNQHIEIMCKSARRILGFVFRNSKEFKKLSTKKLLFTSLVRSKLEYCSVVWNPNYQVHKDRIELIQRRFTYSFINRSNKRVPYSDRLKVFDLMKLSDRRTLQDMLFLYKLLNNFLDNSVLLSCFSFDVPSRLPRYPISILTHRTYKTNLGHHSLIPRLCRLLQYFTKKDISIDIFYDKLPVFKSKIVSILNPYKDADL